MNKVYGFEGEVKQKYGDMTYKLFADVFTACECPLLVPNSLPTIPASRGRVSMQRWVYTKLPPAPITPISPRSRSLVF